MNEIYNIDNIRKPLLSIMSDRNLALTGQAQNDIKYI